MKIASVARRVATDYEWAIGAVAAPVESFLQHVVDHGEVPSLTPQWLRPTRGYSLFADPAAIRWQGSDFVLFEAYHPWQGRGVILGSRFGPEGFGQTQPVLDERDTHFAFPTIFELDGRLICIPDSSDALGVRAYGGTDPFALEPIGHLDGVAPLRDPVIWLDDAGTWHLLGLDIAGRVDTVRTYRASHPLERWQEVGAATPDPDRTARPAGPVVTLGDGVLVRPAQDCRRHYGGGIVVRRLDVTPAGVVEQVVGSAGPRAAWPFTRGMHTVVGLGATTFFDAQRLATTPLALPRRVSRKLIGLSAGQPSAE